MSRMPRSKEAFDQLPPLEQSRVKRELVQSQFGAFCQHLSTADLPSFAPVLHQSDLDELQKRARHDSETSVIAQLLLKLYRSHIDWWKTLQTVLLDKGDHILYKHLNPWDDDGDRVAAARGAQPLASNHANPPASPQMQPTQRGRGPQAPYPASTPLGNTRGLVDPLKPLCEGQKWRRLADLLDLTTGEQLQIKSQVDDVHIHLIDAVINKYGDNATVGTLIDVLRQLGSEGEIILHTMEEQLLIQPVPREGSEAGEGETHSFPNPYESERVGGTSTVTQQPPPYYPLPRVSSSEGNLQPPLLDVGTPWPGSQTVFSPGDFDPNMSNSSHDKVTIDKLVKGLETAVAKVTGSNEQLNKSSSSHEPSVPLPTSSAELSEGCGVENTSSDSLTENDLVPVASPDHAHHLQNEFKTMNDSPVDRVDTAYCSLDSHTGTSAMNIQPINTSQAVPDRQGEAHTGYPPGSAMHVHSGLREATIMDPALQVDSPLESLNSHVQDSGAFPVGPGSYSEPSLTSSVVAEQSLVDNNEDRTGRNTIRGRGDSPHTKIITNYHITISRADAVNVGETNKSIVKKFISLGQGLEPEVSQASDNQSDEESDVNTFAEFDAPSSTQESLSPTGSQYPGVAPPYPHRTHDHRSQYQHQDHTGITHGSVDQINLWNTAHQTSAKQLWTAQEQNSLVEESGASVNRFPYNVPQECEDVSSRLDDPVLGGEMPVSYQSRDADIDLQRLPVEGLNITERESLSSTETLPTSVQQESEDLPAGERQDSVSTGPQDEDVLLMGEEQQVCQPTQEQQQDQQLQLQPVPTSTFLRLFSILKENFETLE